MGDPPASDAAVTLHLGDEETALAGMLDLQREAIDGVFAGLTEDEARLRLAPR